MLHLSLELQPLSKNPDEQHKVDTFLNGLVPFLCDVISLTQKKKMCVCITYIFVCIYTIGKKEHVYRWCLEKHSVVP